MNQKETLGNMDTLTGIDTLWIKRTHKKECDWSEEEPKEECYLRDDCLKCGAYENKN